MDSETDFGNSTVDSELNTAILMSSTQALTEFPSPIDDSYMARLLSHSTEDLDIAGSCKTIHEFTNSSIEECSIWDHLTMIEKSLNESHEHEKHDSHDVIDTLREYYERNPDGFTQNLLTIIEESLIDDSGISNSPTIANSSKASTSSLSSAFSKDSSTMYRTFEEFFKKQRRTYRKTPFSRIDVESRETNSDHESDDPETPSSEQSTHGNIPHIIVNPGTPETAIIRRRSNRWSLKKNEDDDDEYITAESDTDESSEVNTAIITEESESSLNEKTLNLSSVTRRHDKWLKTYEKVASCEARKVDSTKKNANRNAKIADYTNKLEKKMIEKLEMKRAECFNTLNVLLKKAAVKSTQCEDTATGTSSPLMCDRCKRQMQFHNTMKACSEYFTHGKNWRYTLISKPHDRQRSISKSPISSKGNDTNTAPNSVTRRSRQLQGSLRKKGKSSGATLVVNPRRRSGAGFSPVLQESSRRIVAPRSPRIDGSSIKPVSELRRMFSARPEIKESRIPLPTITQKPKRYISKVTVNTASLLPSKPSKSLTLKEFKHVKSPVKEYIEGKK